MSVFLSKIIVRSITKVVRSTAKFDIAIDNIMDKFKDSCPPQNELLKIIKQKNQIQSSLSQIHTILNTLNKTTTSANDIITTLDVTVKIIKRIPAPTAIAGIGIPVSILTTLSDILDKVGRLIEGGKGALNIVPSAFNQIASSVNQITNKLQTLDSVLNPCLDQLLQGMNDEEREAFLSEIDTEVLEVGNFSSSESNLLDSNTLLARLQPNSEEVGNFSSPESNLLNSNTLLARLQPNSDNPLEYKGFRLTLEIDTNNPLSIPSRRIKGYREPNQILYNTFDGGYSYTSNPQVLIDEIKFVIDVTTDYPLIDLLTNPNNIEDFPFGVPGTPLEIRKVYEIIEEYQEKEYNLMTLYSEITKYFVKIRDYRYDTFTKSWDIINVDIKYSITNEQLEEMSNDYMEFNQLLNNVNSTITVTPSLSPFNVEGEYQAQIKKTFEILNPFTNDLINFVIRVYSWSYDKNRWDLIESVIYWNQTVTRYQALAINDPSVVGEHRSVINNNEIIEAQSFLPFPPFGTQGEDGEIRPFQTNDNLYIFQDNEWTPYTSTSEPFEPFGFPGSNFENKITYQLLNTNFTPQWDVGGTIPSSYDVRIRVYRWDGSSYTWSIIDDYDLNLSPSDYQYYQDNHINWDTL